MHFPALHSQTWYPVRNWRAGDAGADREMAAVLTVAGSLTRFIERHYGMALELKVHDQFVDSLHSDEAELLGCHGGAPALRRQVSLMHRGSVMFDAESVLPLDELPADLMQQLEEGEKPLGNLLMDRGLSLARSDLAVAQVDGDAVHAGRWARRSVLRSPAGTRALVVEIFHPEIWKRIERMGRRY
ncbi:MAG TPA: chorismate lyase [Mariprofundaceae bacterium]|nr:chorismate lyase [Mariprofundaceae bacterium]